MKKFFNIINIIGRFISDSDAADDLGDFLLDKVEEYVVRTDNKIDDSIVLPLVKGLRYAFGIPDNDENDKEA